MLVKNIDQLSDDQADQLTPPQAWTKFNGLVQLAQKPPQGLDFFRAFNQVKTLWPKTFAVSQQAFKDIGNLASGGATVTTYDSYHNQVSAPSPFGETEQAPIVPLSPDAIEALGLNPADPRTSFDVVQAAWKANGYQLAKLNKAAVAEAVACTMCGGRSAAMEAYPGLFDCTNPTVTQKSPANSFSAALGNNAFPAGVFIDRIVGEPLR